MLTFSQLGRYGRLGNQMFQVAGVIGLATRHGYEFGFPYWKNHDHLERFGSSEDIDIQEYFANPLPPVENRKYSERFVQWGYHNVTLPDNTDITGHMQSEKYFAHCTGLVRNYFKFKEMPQGIIPEGATSIHVRRGDYDDHYHPTQKEDYYRAALAHIPIDSEVFVFSDDIDAARAMLGDGYHYMRGNHYITDLKLMTQCKNHILSNSTLCWWGWWLSGKKGVVVAPSKWFGAVAGISAKDIYTPEMIVI